MNADIADNSLVSLTLPESVENKVHAVNLEILIEIIFEMKSLNKTGLSMNLKIQIWFGLTGKQNFCALSIRMLHPGGGTPI